MKYNPMHAPQWQQIDTVLLDMDGTLLDLHFDNYFWLTYVPQCYAKLRGISEAEALADLNKSFVGLVGTLDWYCLDFWADLTGLNIDRKSTRLNSSHVRISYAVFCLK